MREVFSCLRGTTRAEKTFPPFLGEPARPLARGRGRVHPFSGRRAAGYARFYGPLFLAPLTILLLLLLLLAPLTAFDGQFLPSETAVIASKRREIEWGRKRSSFGH